jgi:hypothetical protein
MSTFMEPRESERAFLLSEPRPCSDALGWLEREGFATLAEAWAACNRLGWLTWWLAFKAGLGVARLRGLAAGMVRVSGLVLSEADRAALAVLDAAAQDQASAEDLERAAADHHESLTATLTWRAVQAALHPEPESALALTAEYLDGGTIAPSRLVPWLKTRFPTPFPLEDPMTNLTERRYETAERLHRAAKFAGSHTAADMANRARAHAEEATKLAQTYRERMGAEGTTQDLTARRRALAYEEIAEVKTEEATDYTVVALKRQAEAARYWLAWVLAEGGPARLEAALAELAAMAHITRRDEIGDLTGEDQGEV